VLKLASGWLRANGGGGTPSVYLKNLEDVETDLTDNRENTINVDLAFKKKIKVI